MLNYFGLGFLQDLQGYYAERLAQALSSGFEQPDHKYHWLYEELLYRTNCTRQLLLVLNALPQFLDSDKPETAFQYIYGVTLKWFSQESIEGAPRDKDHGCLYFTDACRYWTELDEAFNLLSGDYPYSSKPLFYVDLCEYAIRSIRLHFYIREQLNHAIDRNKFDGLMCWKPALGRSA